MNFSFELEKTPESISIPSILSMPVTEKTKSFHSGKKKRAPSPCSKSDNHDGKQIKLSHSTQQAKEHQLSTIQTPECQEGTDKRGDVVSLSVNNNAESRSEVYASQDANQNYREKAEDLSKKVMDFSAMVEKFSLESTRKMEESELKLRELQTKLLNDLLEIFKVHDPELIFRLQEMKKKHLDNQLKN